MNDRNKAIRWKTTRRADKDIEEIATYTESMWGHTQRRRYLALIEKCFDDVVKKPLAGKDFGYLRSGYRRESAGEHYVFYRLTSDNIIEIIRVIHQRRDVIRRLLEDEDGY